MSGFGHTTMDSIPEFVMRTGVIAPFAPGNARRDIQVAHVQSVTNLPVGQQPGMAGYFGQDEMQGYFGAVASVQAQNIEARFWLFGGVGAAAVGALGGMFVGGSGRRGIGALTGALIGAAGAMVPLVLIRQKGSMQVGDANSPSGLFWKR